MSKQKPNKDLSAIIASEVAGSLKKEIKELANEQITKINTRTKKIHGLLSSHNSIKKRYSAEKSLVNKLMDTYNQQNWFVKISLGFIAIGVAALASSLILQSTIVTIVIAALSFFSYAIFAGLLTQHGVQTKACEALLAKDISALEENMTKSVAKLSLTEDNLQKIMLSLIQKNTDYMDKIEQLGKKIESLNSQNNQFSLVIDELTQINTDIQSNQEALKTTLLNSQVELQKLKSELDALHHVNQSREQINDSLGVDSKILNNICQQYDNAQATLNRLNTAFEAVVSESQHQASSNKAQCQQLLTSLNHSVIDTIETHVKTEEALANSKKCIESNTDYLNERKLKKEADELRTRALREAILAQEHTPITLSPKRMN